jgi:hypothetical protein
MMTSQRKRRSAELVQARSVLIRRVGRTTAPAEYVATRLISRLIQDWRVRLDDLADDHVALSVWVDESSQLDQVDAEIRASFPADANPGWELLLF